MSIFHENFLLSPDNSDPYNVHTHVSLEPHVEVVTPSSQG